MVKAVLRAENASGPVTLPEKKATCRIKRKEPQVNIPASFQGATTAVPHGRTKIPEFIA